MEVGLSLSPKDMSSVLEAMVVETLLSAGKSLALLLTTVKTRSFIFLCPYQHLGLLGQTYFSHLVHNNTCYGFRNLCI